LAGSAGLDVARTRLGGCALRRFVALAAGLRAARLDVSR